MKCTTLPMTQVTFGTGAPATAVQMECIRKRNLREVATRSKELYQTASATPQQPAMRYCDAAERKVADLGVNADLIIGHSVWSSSTPSFVFKCT